MGTICCCKKKSNNKDSQTNPQESQVDTEKLISSSSSIRESTNPNYEDSKMQVSPSEDENLLPYEKFLKGYLNESIEHIDVFPAKYYSECERGKIIYSKRVILAILKKVFDEKNNEYKLYYNKSGLKMSIKSPGNFLSPDNQIVRSEFRLAKSEFPPNVSIRMIADYLISEKIRPNWDEQLKLYKIIEGEEKLDTPCLIHNWMKAPFLFISERDVVEKRFDFMNNGRYISIETSIDMNYIPIGEGVTRMNDILFITEIFEEGDEFVFNAIEQIDPKVFLPETIRNIGIPSKLMNYYKKGAEAMMDDYDEENLKYYDNDGKPINENEEKEGEEGENNNNSKNIEVKTEEKNEDKEKEGGNDINEEIKDRE